MLSNDNDVADGTAYMDVTEELTMTHIGKQATTPVAVPQLRAFSTSDDSASHGSKNLKMANMANECKSSKISKVNEESK